MKAALLHGEEDIRLENLELAPVEPYGLRIKVLACGVCGSDARMFFTGPTSRYTNPVVLGHEVSGEVIEVGRQVDGYALGDVVTLAPLIPCMRCPACSRGQDNLCEQAQVIGCTVHGGMAEYVTVPSQMVLAGGVVKLPVGTDHRAGALTELVGCCLHGLFQMEIEIGDRVLIIGDGPIGLTLLQLCRLMGAGYVATSGRRPRRRAFSIKLGADEALDANAVDLRGKFQRSLDRVIVAAADIEVTAEAVDLVRPGGDLLLFSGYRYGSTLPVDVNAVHYRELHLHGSIDCTVNDFRHAAKSLSQLDMERLVTASFSLERTVEAFYATRDRDAVKVVIEP
jgi:L-iditol 2-dehydrogenase